jgi:hypothetical protein
MADFLGAFERRLTQMGRDRLQRQLDSQEPFIVGEVFHYGAWHKWRNATGDERAKIIAEFRAKHPPQLPSA